MNQSLALCWYAHALLQDLLVLNMGPHALMYTLQHPNRSGDASPLSSLQPLPIAHVLVQNKSHLISASLPPSSLHAKVSLVPNELDPQPSMPLSLEVPHMQKNTKDSVNIHIHIYNQMLAIKTIKHNTKTYL
jgi:hypothetical protein